MEKGVLPLEKYSIKDSDPGRREALGKELGEKREKCDGNAVHDLSRALGFYEPNNL